MGLDVYIGGEDSAGLGGIHARSTHDRSRAREHERLELLELGVREERLRSGLGLVVPQRLGLQSLISLCPKESREKAHLGRCGTTLCASVGLASSLSRRRSLRLGRGLDVLQPDDLSVHRNLKHEEVGEPGPRAVSSPKTRTESERARTCA